MKEKYYNTTVPIQLGINTTSSMFEVSGYFSGKKIFIPGLAGSCDDKCSYCQSNFIPDVRGNCNACGAPQ